MKSKTTEGVLQTLSASYTAFAVNITTYLLISHILSVVKQTKSVKCIAETLKTGDNGTPSSQL